MVTPLFRAAAHGGRVPALAAVFLAAVFLVTLTSCTPKPPATGAAGSAGAAGAAGGATSAGAPGIQAIAVQVAPVKIDSLVVTHQASGTVTPAMQSQVVGQVAGVVARVARKAGDWVSSGETVIQLDDSQLQLSVKAAEASLEAARINLSTGQDTTRQANPALALQVQSAESTLSMAQRNYDSRKALFDLGGATGADMDKARGDLDAAKANLQAARNALDQNKSADVQNLAQLQLGVQQAEYALQQARLNLQHASIRAPYAGMLVSVKVMPGEFVGQNGAAFIIGSREREVDFAVPPADAATLPVGAPVSFELGGRTYSLKVTQSAQVPLNGVVPLVAALPPSLPLTYGAVGTAGYTVSLARGALVLTGSLQTSEDQNFVYVVENGKAMVRRIVVLAESGNSAAVSGIVAGDMVVVNPPPGLLDGSVVKSIPVAAAGSGA